MNAAALLVIATVLRVPDQALPELLRLVFSWPTVAALLGVIVLLRFHAELAEFIKRVGSIEATAQGIKVAESQQRPLLATSASNAVKTELPEVHNQELERELAELRKQAEQLQRSAAADQWAQQTLSKLVDQLRDLFQERDREATYWQFMFFAVFFSPLTHAILRWLAGHGAPVTKSYLHAVWAASVPDVESRNASLKALTDTGVVHDLGSAYMVTDVGHSYLNFASSLPPGVGNNWWQAPIWPVPPASREQSPAQ